MAQNIEAVEFIQEGVRSMDGLGGCNEEEANMDWWNYTDKPAEAGWYAVLVCYDEQEGAFPRAAYWDGAAWKQKAVVAFGEKRDAEDAAERLAYEHDPDA